VKELFATVCHPVADQDKRSGRAVCNFRRLDLAVIDCTAPATTPFNWHHAVCMLLQDHAPQQRTGEEKVAVGSVAEPLPALEFLKLKHLRSARRDSGCHHVDSDAHHVARAVAI
jgi:hypothetical protein